VPADGPASGPTGPAVGPDGSAGVGSVSGRAGCGVIGSSGGRGVGLCETRGGGSSGTLGSGTVGRIDFAGSGRSYVSKAGPEFEMLAANDLADGPDYTTPAGSGGRLLIKGKSYRWCVGAKWHP
jgi:hypothetical protein